MIDEKINKKKAQVIINDAMKICQGPSFVKQSRKCVDNASYNKLTEEQLNQGVVGLVIHLNLSGGSVDDMNLYKLLRTYLWNPDARSSINAVVAQHGL